MSVNAVLKVSLSLAALIAASAVAYYMIVIVPATKKAELQHNRYVECERNNATRSAAAIGSGRLATTYECGAEE